MKTIPFLEAFYGDKPGAAFQAQLHFLVQRFKQWQALDQATEGRPSDHQRLHL